MEKRRTRIPQESAAVFEAVAQFTDAVCMSHLDAEYRDLCRELAAALARKRPSPLLRGRAETWACGIVHAIGSVNFLFDPSQTPHIRAADLCQLFGVSQGAGSARSKFILNALRIGPLEPRWTLRSRLAENPAAWMIQINGLIVDVRQLPRNVQEEAYRLGFIPYVPDERV